jgi:hypothetical protein
MAYYLSLTADDSLRISSLKPKSSFSADLCVKIGYTFYHSFIEQLLSFRLITSAYPMCRFFPPKAAGLSVFKPHSANCAAFFILFPLIIYLYNYLTVTPVNSNSILSFVTYDDGRHNLNGFITVPAYMAYIDRFFQYEEEKDE